MLILDSRSGNNTGVWPQYDDNEDNDDDDNGTQQRR